MTDKKSFVLFKDLYRVVKKLPDEQAGRLIKAIFEYQITGELPELDFTLDMVVTPIISQFERDQESYEKIVKRNQKNGLKGGRPKEPKKPSGLSRNPSKPKEPDTVNGTDSDSESEKKDTAKAVAVRISDFYNLNRGMMSRCSKLTPSRISAINARVNDLCEADIEETILKAKESDFMQGRTDTPFSCGIDWVMNPTNFMKIFEGNYDNKKQHSSPPQQTEYKGPTV